MFSLYLQLWNHDLSHLSIANISLTVWNKDFGFVYTYSLIVSLDWKLSIQYTSVLHRRQIENIPLILEHALFS